MIIYRTKDEAALAAPAWLEGAADLHERINPPGRLWAIGDGLQVADAPDRAWSDVGDGWQARVHAQAIGVELARHLTWCPTSAVSDRDGNLWAALQLLDANGNPRIAYKYGGPSFMPVATPDQKRALDIAEAARSAFLSGNDLPREVACTWAAELLALANHISVGAIAALGLLDDVLVVHVLRAAALGEGADGE